jgi:hypothetical protein
MAVKALLKPPVFSREVISPALLMMTAPAAHVKISPSISGIFTYARSFSHYVVNYAPLCASHKQVTPG